MSDADRAQWTENLGCGPAWAETAFRRPSPASGSAGGPCARPNQRASKAHQVIGGGLAGLGCCA
eukprot:CAMPEP_0176276114 /NCGR_PEP_ID=MMETSP0121_2-20121125/47587_1 /TAXON_ID=160619 /ORGANISM="Kryptoperidinium foliaceum, Strain CCMP 1326" /LENGTH=63 /DNA_ID=CAMNT_0017616357 /DNA_START=56 /DNA_END=244 /DNA_ORIENTATION=+